MDKTCLVYIHGVQPDLKTEARGYSKEFHKKILEELQRLGKDVSKVRRFEVSWSNITIGFKRKLAQLQFDANPELGFKRRQGFLSGALRNFIYPAVIDILFYVKNKGSANAPGEMVILERLHNAVKKAKAKGFKKVVIFAHSLGTVAAYDYVFRFREKYAFPKNLELTALVTFGSPISLFASGMGHPMSSKIKRPKNVKKWLNLWDPHDGVSGRCEPHFPKNFAKGFLKDVLVDTGLTPLRAHQRYWSHKRVIRKMAEELAR